MNTSTGLVLGFFRDHATATGALSTLRAQGYTRSASITKNKDGRVVVDAREVSDNQGAVIGGVLGLVAGSLLPLAGAALPSVRALRGLTSGAGAIVGAAAGRLLARNVDLSLSDDILQTYRRSVVRGETLVLAQVPSGNIEKVLSILRENDDHRPTTFIVRAALDDTRLSLPHIARSVTALKDSSASTSRRPFPSGDGTIRIEPLVGDRLREHARRTATRHGVLLGPGRARPLLRRLRENERAIGGVNRSLAEAARLEQPVSLSAEWLLDNSYIIQSQVADVRRNLSREFYAELPVLMPASAKSPRGGTTRAYGIARDLVAYTDARLDAHNIEDYVSAYQSETPLTMGELWALPLMFRVALIENLRRLTTQVDLRQRDRERADFWSSRLLAASHAESDQIISLLSDLSAEQPILHDHFADRLISHLYDEEAALVPVRSWIETKAGAPLGELIQREQRRQAADQISVANTIGSLRTLGQIDWSESFEKLSLVEHTLRDDPAETYAHMDFATRDAYRHEIERIARGAQTSTAKAKTKRAPRDVSGAEIEIARRAVETARQSTLDEGADQSTSVARHVGYFLIDNGVRELEGRSDYSAPLGIRSRNWLREHPETAYFGAIGLGTTGAVWATLKLAQRHGPKGFGAALGPLAILASGPAGELAVQIVNYLVTRLLSPRALPKLDFEMGIPHQWRTLVVVPMMLTGEDDIREEVEKLEVRYLANPDANLRFALLADYLDAGALEMPEDKARLEIARSGIEQLNRRYGPAELGGGDSVRPVDRFLLFGRERRWSATENKWMGWERKRGKLEELNDFLCGEEHGAPDRLHPVVGNREAIEGVKFVITLDADTQLPQGSARRLVETLAHPLNRPGIGGQGSGVGEHNSRTPNPEPRTLPQRGYTVIQPRVSTSLPSATATRFSRLFTDPTGSDPYTHAVSDVYQDLFGEGSYHGKGIYDVQAFHKVLSGRFPDATLLSHDLIEGAHVRVGLASDVELFDQFPANYLSYSRRNHRWLRGDWQILDWVLSTVPSGTLRGAREANALTLRNRWKVADNLRRSQLPVASVALLVCGWLHSPGAAVAASSLILSGLLLPTLTQVVTWLPRRVGGTRAIARELGTGTLRGVVQASLLPHSALLSIDAIARTLRRRSHQRDLLEWETAQSNYASANARERAFIKRLGGSTLFAIGVGVAVATVNAAALPFAAPYLLGWAATPLLVRWLSGRDEMSSSRDLSGEDLSLLRRLSRQTWRYFDDFIGPQTNWLPPDNYQEALRIEIAQRTSPTNIGLWLLSLLSARDFGYVPLDEVIGRTKATLDTLGELERYRGHFLNWYAVQTLEPLRPRYVSTVDSGNLLSSLWTMAQGVREMLTEPLLDVSVLHGLNDTLGLLKESFGNEVDREIASTIETLEHVFDVEGSDQSTVAPAEIVRRLNAAQNAASHLMQLVGVFQLPRAGNGHAVGHELANLEAATSDPRTVIAPASYWAAQIGTQVDVWIQQINRYLIWIDVLGQLPDESTLAPDDEIVRRRNEVLQCTPSLEDLARGDVPAMQRLLELRGRAYLAPATLEWLDHLADEFGRCRWLAGEMRAQGELLIDSLKRLSDEMNMRFLYDEDRKLFTIGFSVEDMRRDSSYYDLLASECRMASFATVARGEVPLEHWVALGRRYGDCGGRAALMSWSGTMFEYLMPLLLMKPFENSLLAQSCREAVLCQIDYGRQRGVPWGISEAAFAALDAQRTYQYKAFGVPALGLKRGLEDELVVAPYATMMAFALMPKAAMQNLHRLLSIGMRGDYGLYESIDYSRQRLRDDDATTKDTETRGAIVRCFMVHHQGMSLVALDNFLHGGAMQNRFHADPYVQGAESLLHERIPAAPPVVEEVLPERPPARLAIDSLSSGADLDRFASPDTPLPRVHLLSNGHYAVMVTNAGGGYSRWNDFEITRWRADSTRDNWGTWFYLKDLETNVTWSSSHQPLRRAARQADVLFAADKAEFRRRDADIETQTEVFVSPEDDAEIRRLILTNRSNRPRTIEVTSYSELSLAPHAADRAHPAFNKLFIQTAALPEGDALLAWRRLRSPKDTPIWAGHLVVGDRDSGIGIQEQPVQSTLNGAPISENENLIPDTRYPIPEYETDRSKFVGRGRSSENPVALNQALSGSTGAVLDPIFSLRVPVTIEPGERVEVAFVTVAGDSRDKVLSLVEKYRDPASVRRAIDVAWTHAQLEMHQLRIQAEDGQRFQQLASHMVYPFAALRAPAKRIRANQKGQNGLWAYGISGDLPVMLVAIDDLRDIAVVRQALVAHSYWRVRGLMADLVILNEQAGGYNQDLTEQLSNLIMSQSHHVGMNQPGGVFLRTTDTLPEEDLTLLLSVARVVLVAARGGLVQQLANVRALPAPPPRLILSQRPAEEPSAPLPFLELPYFNGLGGFTTNGREYAIYLGKLAGPGGIELSVTPAPWSNIMANPKFGAMVTEAGGGYCWSGNSQSNKLTPWSNDPVSDTIGEAIYIRDEDSGTFWTPTSLPIRELDPYRTRHGAGYSIFEHNSHSIEQELITFVPMSGNQSTLGAESAPLRVQRLRLKNQSSRRRRLTVTSYSELIMGTTREETQPHVVTAWDTQTKVLLARNAYHPDFGHRMAFASSSPAPRSYGGDRTSFLGRNGSPTNPSAMRRKHLSNRAGAAIDACAAVQVFVEIEPHQEVEVTFLLGQTDGVEEARALVERFREPAEVERSLRETQAWWDSLLGTIEVETPILSVNFLLNRWLPYQTLSCRIWGRSAFYQSGGAFGFRDQLQDVMGMVYALPEITRAQILRAAAHQFSEGDVQHWWHEPSNAGVRTRISDDLLFLPYVVAHYIRVTGDTSVLDEEVPFLGGRLLEEDEHETYMPPEASTESATIFEHCRRAVEKGCTRGPHDLPLIGAGDWNDGMNRVGVEGKGESVWLAWFAIDVLNQFADICAMRKQSTSVRQYRARARAYAKAVEASAWDGEWYLRAFFDDGTPLGSHTSDEAKIDALPQAWSVLSGVGDVARSQQALQSLETHLVKREDKMILLFTPAFDKTATDPGYIKGYLPGVRENGGQYTHAAVWSAMSFARAGQGTKAVELLKMLNPVEHAREPQDVAKYKVEPYVVAADIYALENQVGRGGWTWYTGSASWMYRAWIEEVLGLQVRGSTLSLDPSIPTDWPGFVLRYRYQSTLYVLDVQNPDGVESGVSWIELDGKRLRAKVLSLVDDGSEHRVVVRMGHIEKKAKVEGNGLNESGSGEDGSAEIADREIREIVAPLDVVDGVAPSRDGAAM